MKTMDNFKVHLKEHLGLNKSAIKKSYEADGSHLSEDEHTERGFDEIKRLLDQRTQLYTIADAKQLVGIYLTSSDWCVCDNTGNGEFSAVEEYQANAKYDRMEEAMAILDRYEQTIEMQIK